MSAYIKLDEQGTCRIGLHIAFYVKTSDAGSTRSHPGAYVVSRSLIYNVLYENVMCISRTCP